MLYVPGMKCNLLSIDKLVEKGFSVTMGEGMLKVYDLEKVGVEITNIKKLNFSNKITSSGESMFHYNDCRQDQSAMAQEV